MLQLVVGGMAGQETRADAELVAGLEVRRCSPPSLPRPVMAATGQTVGGTAVVCGGADRGEKGINSFKVIFISIKFTIFRGFSVYVALGHS